MRAAWALFRREVTRFYRDRSRIIGTLATPLVLFAFVAGGFSSFTADGERFATYLLPGTLALSAMMTAIFSTISIIDDRKAGFLQGVLVAPVSRGALVAAKVAAGACLSLIQATLVLVPLMLLQGAFDLTVLPLALLSIAMTGAALTALGFAIAWHSESTQGYHGVMNGLLMPMWALSGSLFPASGASPTIAFVIRVNPLSPFVALMRSVLHGSIGEWTLPLVWTVVFTALAVLSARRSARAVMAMAVLVLFMACKSEPPPATNEAPELTFKALRFAQYEHGKLVVSATAKTAKGALTGGLELGKVTILHKGLEQSGTIVISAATGVVGTEGSEPSTIELSGGVVIKDQHDRVVTTDNGKGTFGDKRFIAQGRVRLESKELKLEGKSADGSLDTMEFTLHGPVKGSFDAEAARATQP